MKNYQNAEVYEKVTGRAVYGADLNFPGMLVGKVLRSPHPHGKILKIDTSRAQRIPGVIDVITGKDLQQKHYGIAIPDEEPLATEKVRYMGDEVAAVAARGLNAAREALEAIEVEYHPLTAVNTPEEALQTGAPSLHQDFPGNLTWERYLERGDMKKAFEDADVVVEDSFSIPAVNQAYLEPVSCVAIADRYHGVTIHTSLQSPHMNRNIIAGVLGLPPSRLRIVCPYMGGGFGGKVFGNQKAYILASLLSMRTGQPVKIQLTREEEFIAGRPMPEAWLKLKMALKKDGTFLGRQSDILIDNGAYSAQMPFVSKTLSERNDSLYHIPNLYTRARLVYTNRVPTGQYRAYGNQVANFAYESLIDLAAQKIGMDPLQIRLKNCIRQGDVSVHGLKMRSCALPEALETAAREIGWKQRRPVNRGVGLACCIHTNGNTAAFRGFSGASASARLEEDGRVTIITGEQDYGQGTHSTFAQIAARVLDIPPDWIIIHSKDTATTPFSLGAFACRQLTIGGNAVRIAAENLKKKIKETAGKQLENLKHENTENLELKAGKLVTATGKAVPLEKVARQGMYANQGMPLVADGYYEPPETTAADESGYGHISATYSFAAHAIEVEVDPETGEVTPLRLVAVHDSGEIINQLVSEGQVYGGVSQGYGYARMEGYLFREGEVLNPGFHVYHIPTSLDMPPVKPIFLENKDPVGPFGAKGIGEIVQVPSIAAYVNAIADASGARVTELPASPEKVFFALNKGKKEGEAR